MFLDIFRKIISKNIEYENIRTIKKHKQLLNTYIAFSGGSGGSPERSTRLGIFIFHLRLST
jgi:hypothetical protein